LLPATCQSATNNLVNQCGSFLGLIQSNAALIGASDQQIEAAIGNNKPSAA
jgi:hypothetical protein